MKRLLTCFLALVTLLTCLIACPVQVQAAEEKIAEITSQKQQLLTEEFAQIEAIDPNQEMIVGKPGNGTPDDLVLITEDTPARQNDGTLSGYVPTEQEAYQIMIAQKAYFPEGMEFTNDHYYDWKGGIWYRGYGCAGFCFYLSDLCFDDRPCYQVYQFYYDQIRVGDILRVNNDQHSVTVMEKYDSYIVLAEANYGGTVHWGRIMTYEEVMRDTTYLLSRYPKDGWYMFDDYMYYFNNDVAVTGWAHDESGNTYYFDQYGRMLTGWQKFDAGWRFFNEYGYMATGWLELDGKYYCFNDDGIMLTGWVQSNTGNWYYLNSSGVLLTGWNQIGGKWYYMNENSDLYGAMQKGWLLSGGNWYYLGSSGAMLTGWQVIDGKWYYLGSSGAMKTGWQQIGGKWYYLNSEMKTGWQKISGKWYYLNSEMKTGWQCIGGKWYYLNSEMKTGWQQIGGKWYYMNSSGVMQTGWLQQGGKWYYLNSNGAMVTGTHYIDGKKYYFNSNGVMSPAPPITEVGKPIT